MDVSHGRWSRRHWSQGIPGTRPWLDSVWEMSTMPFAAFPPARKGPDDPLFWPSGSTHLSRLNLDPTHQDRKDGDMLGVQDAVVVAA